MVIMQFIWLDFILALVTSGASTAAIICYIVSLIVTTLWCYMLWDSVNEMKKKNAVIVSQIAYISEYIPIGNKNIFPIIFGTLSHVLIAVVLLGVPLLSVPMVILSLIRLRNSDQVEKLLCQN